jgi:hypothetical protein
MSATAATTPASSSPMVGIGGPTISMNEIGDPLSAFAPDAT